MTNNHNSLTGPERCDSHIQFFGSEEKYRCALPQGHPGIHKAAISAYEAGIGSTDAWIRWSSSKARIGK